MNHPSFMLYANSTGTSPKPPVVTADGPIYPDFRSFMYYADLIVQKATGSFGLDDFADAEWRDLFDSSGGLVTDEQILDLLAEADDLFALMISI